MGYQQRLEEMIAKEFPGTDIRMSPHINLKLQTWKKQHGALNMIMFRTGVGFNKNGNHMIEVEDDQWESIVKAMRYKSWPLLDDWNEVFGKDRANGDNAEDIEDAAIGCDGDQVHTEQESQIPGDFTADDDGENNVCHPASKDAAVNMTAERKGKKRKGTDNVSMVAAAITEISRTTAARLDTLAQRIGHEFDVDEARKDAYNITKDLGLKKIQRFEVAEIFVDKLERYVLFKGLPKDVKSDYVKHLLSLK